MSQKWKSAQIPIEKHSNFKCSKAWEQSLAHITSIATTKMHLDEPQFSSYIVFKQSASENHHP